MQAITPMTAITAADPPPMPPAITSVFVLAESSIGNKKFQVKQNRVVCYYVLL